MATEHSAGAETDDGGRGRLRGVPEGAQQLCRLHNRPERQPAVSVSHTLMHTDGQKERHTQNTQTQ